MARKQETKIQAAILARLSAEYHPRGMWWRNNTGVAKAMSGQGVIRFGLPGSPDVIGCLEGRFIGVEVKTPTGEQEESQRRFQKAFEKAGGIYVLARSPDEAIAAINRRLNAA